MRLLTVLLTAALFQGCLIIANSHGSISASWDLQTPSGAVQQCLPGETVTITAGSTSYSFACDQYGGTTGPIPIGTYTASFTFTPADGASPVTTITQVVDVYRNATTDVGLLHFQVADSNVGSVTFQWQIFYQGATQTCFAGEQIRFSLPGQTPYFTSACSGENGSNTYAETVSNLAPGSYTYTAELYYNGAPETGPQTVVNDSFVIVAGSNVTEPFSFQGGSSARRDGNAPERSQP